MSTSHNGHGSSSRGIGMLLAGAAGGMLLGKLLPVLLANARGAIRGAAGQDPFEMLIQQHHELLSLLRKMESTPAENSVRRMALALRFKRTIAKHAMAEEDIVYPLLRDDADRAEASEKLYREHASMKVHLFELLRSVQDQQAWTTKVQELRAEIEPHAREEEDVEFPRLRNVLNQRQTASLSRKIHQEEALVV